MGRSRSSVTRRNLLIGAAQALGSLAASGLLRTRHAQAASQAPVAETIYEASETARRIGRPSIPGRCQVVALHAELSGDQIRAVIQDTIDELSKRGGGRVIIPGGVWLVAGPLTLRSLIDLHLSRGAVLRFSDTSSDYLPPVLTRWEGIEMLGHSPFIRASEATHVAITGEGTLDGNGKSYNSHLLIRESFDQAALREMGSASVPVSGRVFGKGHVLRPSFIQFLNCSHVLVQDIQLKDMPFWGLHLLYSKHITVQGISVESSSSNNDGIDVDSSEYVLIQHCSFRTKDDCIAIKSGRDADGRRVAKPSQYIVIRDCRMVEGGSAGVAIGSEMSGDVRNVYIVRCSMERVDCALTVKSNLDRGGIVEHIRAWNISVGSCHRLVQVTTNYHSYSGGKYTPILRDIVLDDLRCSQAGTVIELQGAPEAPIRDVVIRKVKVVDALQPLVMEHVEGFYVSDVTVGGVLLGGA